MKVNISGSKKVLTFEALHKAENVIGTVFPDDYRLFMLSFNGGRPKPAFFNIIWKNQFIASIWKTSMVGDFFAIYEEKNLNLIDRLIMFKDRIPEGMVPIAKDPGGNLILLAVKGDFKGRTFFWLHDLDEEYDESDAQNLGFIANSFSEFIESLFE